MEIETELRYHNSIELPGDADCCLLGATNDLHAVYLELYDAAHEHITQIGLRQDGVVFAQGSEASPLHPPPGLTRPRTAWVTMPLNFAGARHRGIRANERVDELAHPLSLPEKVRLAAHLKLEVPAPMILGVIESYSLAEAALRRDLYCVCRRLRIAFAMPQPRRDGDGNLNDYDSASLYLAHFYQPQKVDDRPIGDLMQEFPDIHPHRPMDCMIAGGHLLIADGGSSDHPARLHLWSLEKDDADADTRRKLYG